MAIKYLRIQPEFTLPDISALSPFRSVVIVEDSVTVDWQSLVSAWLVKSGCLYMMAWGKKCSTWDDSVDHANLAEFSYRDIPEDRFVMTTWHAKEPLKEVFWFSKNCADHPVVELLNTLILHVSSYSREKELLSEYADA